MAEVVKLTIPEGQRTVAAMFAAVKRDAKDWRRPHLGASVLGKDCDRAIWYSFRWAQNPDHEGRLIALFDRGTEEEPRVFAKLRAAGIKVESIDPATKRQWHVELGPHMSGSADSIVRGLLEALDVPHVLDVKTASLKQFEKVLKLDDGTRPQSAVARAWKPEYWVQQQLYIRGLRARGVAVEWAALLVVCKDDDRMHLLRFPYDFDEAERLRARGERIVEAEEPPVRISNDPTDWYCKNFCDYHETCQLGQYAKLERNCRTCIHSTAEQTGTWSCAFHQKALDTAEQKRGCASHLLRPGLMPRGWEAVEAGESSITYRDAAGGLWVDGGLKVTKIQEGV